MRTFLCSFDEFEEFGSVAGLNFPSSCNEFITGFGGVQGNFLGLDDFGVADEAVDGVLVGVDQMSVSGCALEETAGYEDGSD